MTSPDMPETRRVHFYGRVQGVFFRKTAERYASSLAVEGYVRNLSDGSVELVVTGKPEDLDRLLEKIVSHYRSNISHFESVRDANPERFDGFRIS